MNEVKIKTRGSISLAEKCPELVKEWDFDKNDKGPEEYSYGSQKKVWWKCKLGHEWESTPNNRTASESGCPYCSGRLPIIGITDLESVRPDLIKEWNYDKNSDILPSEITLFSSRSVWWKCKLGHEWKTKIRARTRGTNCPYCSNNKIIVGYNDLVTTHPDLIKEWDTSKNKDIIPEAVTSGSNIKVWWKCSNKHYWQATIHARTSAGTGCPYCSGNKVLYGFNDLSTKYPELGFELDVEKSKIDATELSCGSARKVWWKCSKNHCWKATVIDRVKGTGCPYCSNKMTLSGFNDLLTTHPQIASEFHQTQNDKLTAESIVAGSNKKVWWIGKCGHEWQATIYNRAILGNGCPICSGKKVLAGYNDLATRNPVLATEWHSTKNVDLLPSDVTLNSHKKVWWQCNLGHEWKTAISSRANGNGCPICNNHNKTSIPEKIIYYYIKQVFKNAISNYYPDWLDGKEVDTYIPEIDLSIEYDGFRWHILERDLEKDKIFKRLRKKLLRLREPNLPDLNDNSICFAIQKTDSDYNYMNEEISKIISYINENYNMSIELDINVERDFSKIRDLIEYEKLDSSLAITHPELVNDWNYEKNGKLKPEHVTCGSGKKIHWKCSECGHEWRNAVYNRSNGQGCPECGKKKRVITNKENKLKKMQYIEKNAKAS